MRRARAKAKHVNISGIKLPSYPIGTTSVICASGEPWQKHSSIKLRRLRLSLPLSRSVNLTTLLLPVQPEEGHLSTWVNLKGLFQPQNLRGPCCLALYVTLPFQGLSLLSAHFPAGRRACSLDAWQLKQGRCHEGRPGGSAPSPGEPQLGSQHWGPSFLFQFHGFLLHIPTPFCPGPGLNLGPIIGHNPIVLQEQLNGWDFSKPLNPSIMNVVVAQGPARWLVKCLGTTELCP